MGRVERERIEERERTSSRDKGLLTTNKKVIAIANSLSAQRGSVRARVGFSQAVRSKKLRRDGESESPIETNQRPSRSM